MSTSLFQSLSLPLLSSPASSQSCSRQGSPPGLQVILSLGARSSLGCYKEIPQKYWCTVPQDSRNCPCSEQREFAGPEKRLAMNFRAKKPWIRGQVFPKPSQASTCVSRMKVLTHQDCSSGPSWVGGCCSLQNVLMVGPLFPHFQGRTRPGDLRFPPLGGLGRGILYLTSPSLSAHTQFF